MDMTPIANQLRQTWMTTLLTIILFYGVTYFLIWAELQTIKSNLVLEEIIDAAVSIDVHGPNEAARYENKVVHFIGPIRIQEPISEPDYNLHVQAVKLRKRVQMYQWIEESTDNENFISEPAEEAHKTYWYHKDWKDYIVDSSLFYIRAGHKNPGSMPMFSETQIADTVKVGWTTLGLEVKRKVNDYYEVWSDTRPDRMDIKLHSGFYYHGVSALEHEIGDLRISFSYAGREDDIYTVVGVVLSGTIQQYYPANFPNSDPISILRKGSYSLDHLFALEKRDANVHTWRYRLIGLIQVFASTMTLHPNWLTLFLQCGWVGSNLRHSPRLWINIVLCCSYTMFIVSIPWLFHKPLFGAMVLGASLLPLLHYSTLLTSSQPPGLPRRRG